MGKPLVCRLFGHDWWFWREGRALRWNCARGCDVGGHKEYASPEEAERYLPHLNRRPRPPTSFLAVLGGTLTRRGKEEGSGGDRSG